MAGFRLDVIKGIRPRISPRLLPTGEAQTAQNLRLGSGSFEVWNGPEELEETCSSRVTTLHRMRNDGVPFWLQFAEDVDVARGPVPNDDIERTYYTGLAEPRMTYLGIAEGTGCLPDDYRILGIPAPTGAPSVVGDALPDDAVTGTMTAGTWNTNTLKCDVAIRDGNLPANHAYWMHCDDDNDGYMDVAETITESIDLPIGTEYRVTAVVDANNIRIEDANGGTYVARSTIQGGHTFATMWRTDDTGTTRSAWFRFYIPNGVKITVPAHGLQVDDVIRVTSIDTPLSLSIGDTEKFYGSESDDASAAAAVRTWPASPVTVPADDFYFIGSGYPFVDAWVDTSGAASAASHVIGGGFSWELAERNGVPYSSITADIESRVYVYTFVSELGEEGPPSPASDVVTIPTEGDVVVGDFDTPPSVQRDITAMRIYRSNSGSGDTVFQFVAEIASPFADYTDSVSDIDLGEVLQTESWEPPDENMVGIIALPNGVLAGFFGKTLCFSEPYYPHAWPPEYQVAVDHPIVGLGILPNGVAVLTVGPAYIAAGDHPRAMSLRHFTDSQPCSSKHSIVSTIDSILYSSPDGLASIGAGGFKLVTEEYATKREWQAGFDPTNIRGFWHDGKYFGFHSTGGFVFDPYDLSIGLTTLSTITETGYLDAEEDVLYLVLAETEIPVFVAVTGDTDSNTTQFQSSPDGITWTTRTNPTEKVWADIDFSPGLGMFAAVASNQGVVTSEDGIEWTARQPGQLNDFQAKAVLAVTAGFIATGTAGNKDILFSADGITWETIDMSSAAFFNDIAVNSSGYYVLFSSLDKVWVGSNLAAVIETFPVGISVPSSAPLGYCPASNLFLSHESNAFYSSPDGITWTLRTALAGSITSFVWAQSLGRMVAVGNNIAATSPDGITWTPRTPINATWTGVTFSETLGLFVAVSGSAADTVMTSPDGITWTARSTPGDAFDWTAVTNGDTRAPRHIYQWDEDEENPLTGVWKSGRVPCPYPLNLGAARVIADSYADITLEIWNDRGNLVTTRAITSDEVIRLPGGYLTSWFEIRLTSDSDIIRVAQIAETVGELLQG